MGNSVRSEALMRYALIIIWWISFAVNLGTIIYLYAEEMLESDDFWPAVHTLNALYVPYLGTITAFYWGKRGSTKAPEAAGGDSQTGNILAICCSLLWNGMMLFFIARLLTLTGTIEDALEAAEKLGGIFVWLVAPAIGYYFAKSGSGAKSESE